MSTSVPSVSEAKRAGTRRGEAPAEPIYVSAPLPPRKILRTSKVWSKLLHAAALPVVVGLALLVLEGQFSFGLFKEAWPVMALLGVGYLGAWVLNSKFERYPFLNQFEAAIVSVGYTLVPAGVVLYALPGSPVRALALAATIGSVFWYMLDKLLHRFRNSRLLVLPGGAAYRLLAAPGVSAGEDADFGSHAADAVVADLHRALGDYDEFLADYSMKGLPTYHAGYIYELLTARVLLGASCKTSVKVSKRPYYPHLKRAMDLILVCLSAPLTVPLMGAVALAIRLESPGPALFWQERIGRNGETFQMAKFRSMYTGNDGEHGDVFADEEDDRVTTVGRAIRKLRLDELPQFWNVLKGEMSLIGPRPEQVGLAEDFSEDMHLYEYRHLVRPGISGWAQVLQGYAADAQETRRKLEHDLYYVKHQSVTLDLLIMYLTLKTIVTGFGAR